jgi:hypothetical protein
MDNLMCFKYVAFGHINRSWQTIVLLMQPCEWIGPQPGEAPGKTCTDCNFTCVLNRKVATVPGEITGASLINSPPQLAALLCPAMTMLLRYQGAQPPAQVNLVRPMGLAAFH